MVYILLFLACAVLLFHKVYCVIQRTVRNYPPGPDGIPILGAIMIAFKQEEYMHEVAQQHSSSPVTMYYLLGVPIVSINKSNAFKSVYRKHTHRYKDKCPPAFNHLENHPWERRKLHNKCMKSVETSCYMKKSIERLLQDSLFVMIDQKATNDGHPYQCSEDIYWIVFASLFSQLYGSNSNIPSKYSQEFNSFIQCVENDFNGFASIYILHMIYDTLKFFDFNNKLTEYLYRVIGNANYRPKIIVQIEKWYQQSLQCKTDNGFVHQLVKHVSVKQMALDATDMITAGMITTSMAIRTALYLFCGYQNLQQNVVDELRKYCEVDSITIQLRDLSNLHLFRAFINESMRMYPPAKTSFQRNVENCDELKIGDYSIPKNAEIIGNIFSMNRDESVWKTPNEFNLQHFLDENGNFQQNPSFVPFSYGKRDCFGQQTAMNQIYLIVSALVLRYQFEIPESYSKNKMEFQIPNSGVLSNEKFKLLMKITKRSC